MKRLVAVVCILFVGAALGASTSRSFSYLPSNLNAPVTVTAFEWRAACAKINCDSLPFQNQISASLLTADPCDKAVFVRCLAHREPGAKPIESGREESILASGLGIVQTDAIKRFSVPANRMVIFLSISPLGTAVRVFGKDHFLLAADEDATSRREFPSRARRAAQTGHW